MNAGGDGLAGRMGDKPRKRNTQHTTNLEWNQARISVSTTNPLFGWDGGLVRQRVRVEILLEKLGLSWHRERDRLAEPTVVESIEARDFASADVTTALWHEADASLWIWRLEGIDVVHKRWLRCNFKVADHGIAFAAEEHQIGVGVVKREHDSIGGVEIDHHDRFWERIRCAKTVLTFWRTVESKNEQNYSLCSANTQKQSHPVVKISPWRRKIARVAFDPSWHRASASISPVLGSIMRIFLSLQVVTSFEPSQLKQALKTMSGWQSMWIKTSPVPTFQMTTWLSDPAVSRTFSALGCHSTSPTRRWWYNKSTTGSVSVRDKPPSGICHTLE